MLGKALSLAGKSCSGVERGSGTLQDFVFGFRSFLVHLGHISQVFSAVTKTAFQKKLWHQRLPRLMGVKGEFSWCMMRTECLHRDRFRQHFSGLETRDVTSVVQAPFP